MRLLEPASGRALFGVTQDGAVAGQQVSEAVRAGEFVQDAAQANDGRNSG